MSKRKFLCLDCNVDIGKIFEHYFIHIELWLSLVGTNKGMLCVGCLEARLGRQLTSADFTPASINTPNHEPKSQRLMQRLNQ